MQLEFPYQIVLFLSDEPELGESVYAGERGWYPQIAIKRRFKLRGISEEDFIEQLKVFFGDISEISVHTSDVIKTEPVPVRVIHVTNQDELKNIHIKLMSRFNDVIISRYPERENENYYPHITAEYDNKYVIPIDEYVHKTFQLDNVWLLKDVNDENSQAHVKIR